MIKRVICPECGLECQYDNKSVWEGNREMEDFECPVCGHVLDTVFTDQIPNVILIKKARRNNPCAHHADGRKSSLLTHRSATYQPYVRDQIMIGNQALVFTR